MKDRQTPHKKLSVLMVAACPFPANYGSPASIREMSDTLASFGHEVHILTYPFGDDLPVHHAQVHRIPDLGWSKSITVGPTLQKPLLDLMMVFSACHLIWEHRCDVIHAHNYEGALVGLCAKILTRRPLLYNAVNSMTDELPGYKFIRPAFLAKWLAAVLDWFVPRFPDHITTVSPELKEELEQWGIPPEKITVVPAGVVPEMFERAGDRTRFRKALRIQEEQVVLYTGTLDPFQRIDYLFEAFARLAPESPHTLLLMVSPFTKPAHRQVLDTLAAKLGIAGQIRWVESHPLEDLPDYLAMADVAVAPRPNCPGHPVKLLNYMCARLPIVVAAGAAKGIRHMGNGFICKDHASDDLARGILVLLRDRGTAQRLGQAAYQTILEEFDWRILCRRVEALYYQLSAENAPVLLHSSAISASALADNVLATKKFP
ncbi:MAG TPA: glycosyltransferase family 4 protein [Candidatus Methylacidiphilales bacterium]|nr:glycosyltransferase family 4 protein [Candidatus Methylacidiphilales bacterium]